MGRLSPFVQMDIVHIQRSPQNTGTIRDEAGEQQKHLLAEHQKYLSVDRKSLVSTKTQAVTRLLSSFAVTYTTRIQSSPQNTTSLPPQLEGQNGGYVPGYVHGGYVHPF
jgi:hypothetical protein